MPSIDARFVLGARDKLAVYQRAILDTAEAFLNNDKTAYIESMNEFVSAFFDTRIGVEFAVAAEIMRMLKGQQLEPSHFAATIKSDSPFSLDDAIKDLMERTPVVLKPTAERMGLRISKAYSQSHVIAFAKATQETVVNKVREMIAQSLASGETPDIASLTGWAAGYANTVLRTNVATATTAARLRQLKDPELAKVIPCFLFSAVMDSDTRHNHAAANGIVLKTNNPKWNMLKPPLGYNCRCTLSLLTSAQLKRMGRLAPDGTIKESHIPLDAKPDEGFRFSGKESWGL